MQFPAERARFAVCISNDGYPAALERDRLYRLIADETAESRGMVRVVDESGEGYLYPREFFHVIEPPVGAAAGVREAPPLRFVVCTDAGGWELDLTGSRLYSVLPDRSAARSEWIRVIDETGEDYLYPAKLFRPVDVPSELRQELLRNPER